MVSSGVGSGNAASRPEGSARFRNIGTGAREARRCHYQNDRAEAIQLCRRSRGASTSGDGNNIQRAKSFNQSDRAVEIAGEHAEKRSKFQNCQRMVNSAMTAEHSIVFYLNTRHMLLLLRGRVRRDHLIVTCAVVGLEGLCFCAAEHWLGSAGWYWGTWRLWAVLQVWVAPRSLLSLLARAA